MAIPERVQLFREMRKDDELSSEGYDQDGNVTSAITAAGSKTFAYDSENHLVSVGGGAVSLLYDGDGNRVAKTVGATTTQYLVDDLNPTGYPQVVEELTNGSASRTYMYGLERISEYQPISGTWTPSFYQYDGGGSVRQLTNTSGAVTDRYEYDAFGNTFTVSGGSSTPNNYLYRGEQYDSDLGLYYLRARYYNPTTGRFMSRDPWEGNGYDPNSLHKYLYADGDPVNGIDPTGNTDAPEFALLEDTQLPALRALPRIPKEVSCILSIAATVINIWTGHYNYKWWVTGATTGIALYNCLTAFPPSPPSTPPPPPPPPEPPFPWPPPGTPIN